MQTRSLLATLLVAPLLVMPAAVSAQGTTVNRTPPPAGDPPPDPVKGTVGGGRIADHQIDTAGIDRYSVVGPDGKDIGKAHGVWINTNTGRVDVLAVSAGGTLGVGDTIYGVPWDQVERVDGREKRIMLRVAEGDLRSMDK
jgi:sporulation protein YlmC with PRC-barrel domain